MLLQSIRLVDRQYKYIHEDPRIAAKSKAINYRLRFIETLNKIKHTLLRRYLVIRYSNEYKIANKRALSPLALLRSCTQCL